MSKPAQAISTAMGVVTAAHKCMSTVKVRVAKQVWNAHLRKNYTRHTSYLCDDHALACVPGDIVTIASGLRTSKSKRHVVDAFVSAVRTGEERKLPEGVDGWVKRREMMKQESKRVERRAARAELAEAAAKVKDAGKVKGAVKVEGAVKDVAGKQKGMAGKQKVPVAQK